MFGVFTVNEFQDESNESLEPQDDSTPVADDSVSQDSAPEENGNQADAEEVTQAEDTQSEVAAEAPQEAETPDEAPNETPGETSEADEQDSSADEQPAVEHDTEEADAEEVDDSGLDEPVEETAAEEVAEETGSEESDESPETEEAAVEEVTEPEPEPEPEPEVEEAPEDAPFDPNNIPKKYDSQTFEWYILKVQVNRESSIRDGLLRRIKMEGLEEYFEEVIVPTEDIIEFTRSGKRKVVKRKLYPGYIMVKMMLQDDSWFIVRETPGIGDFTGTFGKPTPMSAEEVERILSVAQPEEETEGEEPQLKTAIPFKAGDRVRVKDGNFQNFEGEVDGIDEANGRVTLIINIFGRSTPVELEHWQIEQL